MHGDFDEIHHAGDHFTWGRGLREAFEPAAKRIALSGTPFRSDGEPIPFLKIDTVGNYKIDFSYDYPAAFRDGVIRELCFHRYDGSATFQFNDDTFTLHTDDQLSEDDAARRLRALLGSRNYMRGFLSAAHDQLLEVRRSKEDAGGLVLCQNADHAVWVQGLLRDIAKQEPALIVSDGDLATSTVDEFRNDTRLWAVAVRQVSEGVDIKRLMVLAYSTNWRTSLFFRQAVGRIMRSEGTDYDTEAYCFIPQDPELVEHAETIEKFQAEVIGEREDDDKPGPPGPGPGRPLLSILDSSDAEFDGLTNRGLHHDQTVSTTIIDLRGGITFQKRPPLPSFRER
jgi:superfamily II DNA or RNA helicase